MTDAIHLHGFRFSVYNRIARVALIEKGLSYETVEVNPFASVPEAYQKMQPFGRVPTLVHGAFELYETAAILRYVDRAFDGPSLTPSDPKVAARMDQVIAIVDSYGYIPLVRQVFSERVISPIVGRTPDEQAIEAGLVASATVLDALEKIAEEALVLDEAHITLADCHLAPMIAYFAAAPEGAAALAKRSSLQRWWLRMAQRHSMRTTEPDLSDIVNA